MKILKITIIVLVVIIILFMSINFYMIIKASKSIKDISNLSGTYDMALVLGCGIKNGEPSLMLRDRLDKAIDLYEKGYVQNIIVSGTHKNGYSEVDVMEKYLQKKGIAKEVIIRDDNGDSTRKSIKNFYHNYKKKKVLIVTQKYHLYRALYLASNYELKATGVYAEEIQYRGQIFREIREIMARIKDFFV